MIRIRRVITRDKQLNEHLLLNIFQESPKPHNWVIKVLHGILPNAKKRITESYAAIEDKEVLTSISLKPQNRKNARWHINKLGIGNCSDETVTKLINYVVNKYGAEGVETFITFIDEKKPELRELFIRGCHFRGGAHLNLWTGNCEKIHSNNFNAEIFSDYKKSHSPLIAQLHNQTIFPQYRLSLSISPEDFQKRFKDAITSKVLYCESSNSIEGYFLIFKRQNKLYIELLLSEAYDGYYPEILKYCSKYIDQGAHILVKKFHTSSKKLEETLESYNFKESESYAVLIKDYWEEVKQTKPLSVTMGAHTPA